MSKAKKQTITIVGIVEDNRITGVQYGTIQVDVLIEPVSKTEQKLIQQYTGSRNTFATKRINEKSK